MATTTTRRPRTEEDPTRADDTHNESRTVANDEIARRAYERYEERGREPGHDMDDLLQAEREIKQSRSAE